MEAENVKPWLGQIFSYDYRQTKDNSKDDITK